MNTALEGEREQTDDHPPPIPDDALLPTSGEDQQPQTEIISNQGVIEIGVNHLARLLHRLNGYETPKIYFLYGSQSPPPYMDLLHVPNGRVTFSHGTSTQFVDYLSDNNAKLRADGTIELLDDPIVLPPALPVA